MNDFMLLMDSVTKWQVQLKSGKYERITYEGKNPKFTYILGDLFRLLPLRKKALGL